MGARHPKADVPSDRVFTLLVCYDIVEDDRRQEVARVLSALGPRVQLSVFECKVRGSEELAGLVEQLRGLIDPVQDQIRVYNFGSRNAAPVIVGQRTIEDWRDYLIL